MKTKHVLKIKCRCPVNGKMDTYEMCVVTRKMLKVEDIISVAKEEASDPCYQEELTEQIALRLGCKVTTLGVHSGVRTKVVCRA